MYLACAHIFCVHVVCLCACICNVECKHVLDGHMFLTCLHVFGMSALVFSVWAYLWHASISLACSMYLAWGHVFEMQHVFDMWACTLHVHM